MLGRATASGSRTPQQLVKAYGRCTCRCNSTTSTTTVDPELIALDQAAATTTAAAAGPSSSELMTPVLTPRQRARESAKQQVLETIQQRKHRKATADLLEGLGSTQTRESTWQRRDSLKQPPAPPSVTLSHLVAAGAHLGHSTTFTHRAARSSVYGTRHGTAYIDLRQTLPALRRAAQVVRGVVERDGIVLFLGSLKGTRRAVFENAARLGENGYGVTRWIPGTISNANEVFSWADATVTTATGSSKSTNPLSFKPSLLVLLSPTLNKHALREATANEIPTIGITDSNVDPRSVTYAIPANDDSVRTVELVAGVLGMAGKEGLELKRERVEREQALEKRRRAAEKHARLTGPGRL